MLTIIKIILFCVHGCFPCLYVFALYMGSIHKGQKKMSDSLELELRMAVSCHMGAGNGSWAP